MRILYTFLQLTWGLPQSLIGLVYFLISKKNISKTAIFHGSVASEQKNCVSLGLFIFVTPGSLEPRGSLEPEEPLEKSSEILRHEYSHTIQSLILGPLYLPVIGVPSIVWAGLFKGFRRKKGIKYRSFYTEKWADSISAKYFGKKK